MVALLSAAAAASAQGDEPGSGARPAERSLRTSVERLRFAPLPSERVAPRNLLAASTPAHRSAGRKAVGGVLGAVAGGLIGATIGGVLDSNCQCDDPHLAGIVKGGAVGIVVGGVVGVWLASR